MDETDQNRLTEGSVPRKMLAFALPIFLSNLFQQLYNAVDSLIVGNFIGSAALAAVGSSASMIMLLVGFINGVSLGAGVVIARFYGADDRENLSRALHTTVAVGIAAGLVLTVVGVLLTPQILRWMGSPRRCHRKFHYLFSSVLPGLQRRSALQHVRQHPPVCGGQPQSHEVSDFVYAQHVVAAIEQRTGKSIQAFVWKGPVESSICVRNERLSLICTKHLVNQGKTNFSLPRSTTLWRRLWNALWGLSRVLNGT